MLLCAGCRVTACCTSERSLTTGCYEWDPGMRSDEFVFHCKWCCDALKLRSPVWLVFDRSALDAHTLFQLKLRGNIKTPRKQLVVFRYDPPVLIIALTWHQGSGQFG